MISYGNDTHGKDTSFRRARYLRDAAHVIVREYKGRMPKTERELRALPGIGHYTANAILAFAHNEPRVFIETNIRRVFIHALSEKPATLPAIKQICDNDIRTKEALAALIKDKLVKYEKRKYQLA